MAGTVIDEYYVGQGDAALFVVNAAGKRTSGRLVGNCPQIQIQGKQNKLQHKESRTAKRLSDNVVYWMDEAMVSLTFDNFSRENLAWITGGTGSDVVSGTVTAEVQKYAPIMQLDRPRPTTVTAKKTGATGNWAADTYSVSAGGLVTIITDPPVAGVVTGDDIEFSYSYGAYDEVIAHARNGGNQQYALLVDVKNKADADRPLTLEIFGIKFGADYSWDFIGEDYGQLQIQGEIVLVTGQEGLYRTRKAA